MEFKRDYESCIFISDEMVNTESENEKTNENILLEKGEKVTDLGE